MKSTPAIRKPQNTNFAETQTCRAPELTAEALLPLEPNVDVISPKVPLFDVQQDELGLAKWGVFVRLNACSSSSRLICSRIGNARETLMSRLKMPGPRNSSLPEFPNAPDVGLVIVAAGKQ